MFRVLQNKKLAATLIPLRYAPISLPCLVVSLGGDIWWLLRFFFWFFWFFDGSALRHEQVRVVVFCP